MKKILKKITPPLVIELYERMTRRYGFFGDYATWEEAKSASCGYDDDLILKKVKDALLKVKSGNAVFERDTVLFDKIQYSWPLLAGLLWIASQNDNRLNLIDFGGSLGSSYFQNRKFLEHLKELSWNIVEQENFVECGRQYFSDEHVKFYPSITDSMAEGTSDTLLLCSVLQYLEKPYEFLHEIKVIGFKYVIVDRTPFLKEGDDRLTVQKVPPYIYEASYPAWLFDKEKLMKLFMDRYELVSDFICEDRSNVEADFNGFIFKLRDNA